MSLIYHYTQTSSVLSIIKNKCLWATEIRYLNDKEEGRYQRDVLDRSLKERLEQESQRLDSSMGPKEPDVWRSNWEFILNALVKNRPEDPNSLFKHDFPDDGTGDIVDMFTPPSGTFVTCFCKEGDLLSQWRGYAGGSGWALGFDRDSLETAVRPAPLVDVKYGPNEGQTVIDQAIGLLKVITERSTLIAPLSLLDEKLVQIKHPAFKEEREVRIVVVNGFETAIKGIKGESTTPSGTKFRDGRYGLTPYREVTFPMDSLRSIVVGPGPNQDEQKFAMEWRLGECGIYNIEVTTSEAPYR